MRAAVVLALVALLVVAPLSRAQDADDSALVRDAYDFVRQYALRPPEASTMLARMLAAVQPHAGDGAVPPSLGGDPQADLEAVAAYAAAVARARPERAEIVLAAVLRALLQDLGDPLAAVFAPAQFARYMEELRGEHGGIGAQVDRIGGRIVISDVTAGGPAARAGLAPGDALLDVNDRPTADRTPDTVLDLLHGRPGTTVAVTVQRGGRAPQRHVLTREVARENPTRSTVLEPRIGYLRLLEFIEGSEQDVGRALAGLRRRGAGALVLDLRQNTGGLVEEAVAVASFFLDEGVVAMEENREGMVPLPVRPAERFAGPVVVLVDFFTASAGEIVAGALQDAGAVLVGTKTFGKATVQSVSIPPLPGGWGLRVTTARYYTRRGRLIEGTGLQPTVTVPMAMSFIQSSQDVQLQEALGRLHAQLGARSGRP